MKRMVLWIALRCLAYVGADDYLMALHRSSQAEQDVEKARLSMRRVDSALRLLLASAKLADGLISSGQPDKAQQQLRVAIIAANAAVIS